MNPDPECNCCPPATCDVCMPQCSSKPYARRAPRPLKYEADCGPKNCSIFGSHDTNPMPDTTFQRNRNKLKDENKNSLGSPIGLVAASENFKPQGKMSEVVQARYATYLKAFARLHLNDEKEWDTLLVDDIMKEGLTLLTNSQKRETTFESPSDIYFPNEKYIMREFDLSGFNFHIELMPKFRLSSLASTERGGKGDGADMNVQDLVPALKYFLRHHKYALITAGTYYGMIWRTKDAYFIFDACGRRLADFKLDKDKGVAMLMCLRCLENVRHLIANLSNLQAENALTIRELKVVKVVTPSGNVMRKDYGKRTHQYEVINDDYAYLKSELHLTLNTEDLLRNRSGLPVAIAAIASSKIDHAAAWDMKMVDKIICFGVSFCQSRWLKCQSLDAIDINEFPTYFAMGQFNITIDLTPKKYTGNWRCVPDFKQSELTQAIKKAFDAGDNKLVVQINNQMYAIWKKDGFIYLLDPYRHRILGKKNEPDIYEEMEKSATVRMFRSFDVFMNVFNQILLDSNRSNNFFIHTVKIKNIQLQDKGKQDSVKQIEEPKMDDKGEVLSLNEHICFEEAENLCRAALGEISDFEDDNLRSDVDEIELKTSSSEHEERGEEEEVGGEAEEIEGIESSSSGEEKGDKKKAGDGDKDAKKGKGGKKGGKKGGTKKTKKGKGADDSEKKTDDETKNKDEQKEKDDKDKKTKDSDNEGKMKKKKKDDDKNKEDKDLDKDKGKDENAEKNKEKDTLGDKGKDKDSKDKDKDKDQDKDKDKDKDKTSKADGKKEDLLKSGDGKKDEKKDKDANKENKTTDDKKNRRERREPYIDGSEADDENEDCFKKKQPVCSAPNPNRYPGYYKCPVDMAVIGSESGSYESICKLFQAGFKVADRVLSMTPWGNFVIFRCGGKEPTDQKFYFLFDGCTCNFDRFRLLDLSVGTAGLICFKRIHDVIEYIRHLRKSRRNFKQTPEYTADDICKEICNKSSTFRL